MCGGVENMAKFETRSPLMMWQHRSQGEWSGQGWKSKAADRLPRAVLLVRILFHDRNSTWEEKKGGVVCQSLGMGREGLGSEKLNPRLTTLNAKIRCPHVMSNVVLANSRLFPSNIMAWNKRNSFVRKNKSQEHWLALFGSCDLPGSSIIVTGLRKSDWFNVGYFPFVSVVGSGSAYSRERWKHSAQTQTK